MHMLKNLQMTPNGNIPCLLRVRQVGDAEILCLRAKFHCKIIRLLMVLVVRSVTLHFFNSLGYFWPKFIDDGIEFL